MTSSLQLRRYIDRICAKLQGESLELFAPNFSPDSSSPALKHPNYYIFVKGRESVVTELCNSFPGLSFVVTEDTIRKYLTLPDATVDALRHTALLNGNTLQYCLIDTAEVKEGDKVEVTTGEFKGLKGIFIPRKGSRTGAMVVAITSDFGVIINHINADCVTVLEFATNTRRPYDQMDAYIPRLLRLLTLSSSSSRDLAYAVIFTRRLGSVRLGNPKTDAKLQLMLFASYRLLGDNDKAAEALQRYNGLKNHITNVWTRAFCFLILGLSRHDMGVIEKARALVAAACNTTDRSLSAIQKTIVTYLTPQNCLTV